MWYFDLNTAGPKLLQEILPSLSLLAESDTDALYDQMKQGLYIPQQPAFQTQ